MDNSCNTCGSTFSNPMLLQAHNRTHYADIVDLYLAPDFKPPQSDSDRFMILVDVNLDDEDSGLSPSQSVSDAVNATHEEQSPEFPVHREKLCTEKETHMDNFPHDPIEIQKLHRCDECGIRFDLASSLRKHIRLCPRIKLPHIQASVLNTDDRIPNDDKPYRCQVCGKSFQVAGGLYMHARIHTGYKPHKCKQCGKSFATSGQLRVHSRVHSGEKPYQCRICGKSFSQGGTLKAHGRVHTGEKPFKCDTCGKVYAQAVSLKNHAELHTLDIPCTCAICGQVCANARTLKRHADVHAEKPYKCDICGSSFTNVGSLNHHGRIHVWRQAVLS